MSRTTTSMLTPIAHPEVRAYQPTTPETKWIDTWEAFKECGGGTHFAEDQAEIMLSLPEGYKFSIRFMKPD